MHFIEAKSLIENMFRDFYNQVNGEFKQTKEMGIEIDSISDLFYKGKEITWSSRSFKFLKDIIYLCEEKNKKAEKDFNMGIINEEKRHEITETTRILINTINRKK